MAREPLIQKEAGGRGRWHAVAGIWPGVGEQDGRLGDGRPAHRGHPLRETGDRLEYRVEGATQGAVG